jgi:predicted HAD superfamily phosphohydrolase
VGESSCSSLGDDVGSEVPSTGELVGDVVVEESDDAESNMASVAALVALDLSGIGIGIVSCNCDVKRLELVDDDGFVLLLLRGAFEMLDEADVAAAAAAAAAAAVVVDARSRVPKRFNGGLRGFCTLPSDQPLIASER